MAGSESRIVECINLMVMKKVYWTLVAIFVAAALGGCVNDPTEMENAPDMSAGSRKILTSAEAEAGELLVKFSKESIAAVEAGVTRSESTRTGIQPFDAALKEISAVSVERVIPVVEQHEADARASGLHRWYRVRFNDQVSLDEAARKLAAVEDVEVVQYDGYVARNFTEMSAVPYNNVWSSDRDQINTRSGETPKFNDPMLNKQWHYKNTGDETLVSPIKEGCDINVEPAWEFCTGDPSIIVAVMDEGVMYKHEDLAANMWVNQAELNGQKGVDDDGNGYVDDVYGYNFAKDQGDITWTDPEDSGHGTHVAGTISAVNNNGIGVCGIAGGSGNNDGVKIMSIQIFAGRYQSTISRNVDAIYYATSMGASILQCSWGLMSGAINSDEQYLDERSIEANAFAHFINMGAEAVGVEAVEVAARPASADQHHGVEFFRPGRDVAQGFDDGFLGRFALHEGVEQGQLETVGASGQLLAEVLIAGGVGARHDGHALHDGRHRRLAVHVPDALLLQLRDGLLPLPLHVAQRVGGVDVGDLEREAVKFVVGDQRLGQYFDARGEPLARFGLEIACDAGVVRTPHDGSGLRCRHAVVAALLHKLQVAVARVVDLDFRNLGAHPEGQRELPFERRLHAALQLAQGNVL